MMALLPFAGFAQVDDMYFIPRKEEPKKAEPVAARDVPRPSAVADTGVPAEEPVYATGEIRDVDEYNRRGYEAWADSLSEDSVEEASEDSGEDYACSKRILRFCTPTIGVAVSSPLYWDLPSSWCRTVSTPTPSRAVGARSIGDPTSHGVGAGDGLIIIGAGAARGMPDGTTRGIGVRTDIILLIGGIPVRCVRDVRSPVRA